MATATATSTPQSTRAPPQLTNDSPGSWQHPKFTEIARRQRASTFNEHNIRRIACNGSALLALLYAYAQYDSLVSRISIDSMRPKQRKKLTRCRHSPTTSPYLSSSPLSLLILVALLLLSYNILTALLPLMRPPDNLTDIPLTPTQRALLGLDPNATPPITPGTTYITPPRYQLSSTPGSGSPRGSVGSDGSGMMRRAGTGGSTGRLTDRGDSPMASPLWGKQRKVRQRESFGTPGEGKKGSPLGMSGSGSPLAIGGGGSPAHRMLNNKWLFERGKRGSVGSFGASRVASYS